MKPPIFRFTIVIVAGVVCLLMTWLFVLESGRKNAVENTRISSPEERVMVSVLSNEPVQLDPKFSNESNTPLRTEDLTDFTGIPYFAELRAAVQKQDQVRIDAAFASLAVHLEEHPGNLPGVMAAMKAENSPEMNSCLARLAAITR